MKTLFLVLSLVFQILKLRKEIAKPGNEALYWELLPMDFKLNWWLEDGETSEERADRVSDSVRGAPSRA